MTTTNFEIGQIVYILSSTAQHIIPGLIVEECVVKKLSGNTISWKIKVGGQNNSKIIDSSKLNGELYGSIEEVSNIMQQNLNSFISKVTKEAVERVEVWYGKELAERPQVTTVPESASDKIDADLLLNSLEHKSASSPVAGPSTVLSNRTLTQEAIRENLKKLATPEEDQVFITDDEGNRVPVKMPKVLS